MYALHQLELILATTELRRLGPRLQSLHPGSIDLPASISSVYAPF